jgi:hypothetical protein
MEKAKGEERHARKGRKEGKRTSDRRKERLETYRFAEEARSGSRSTEGELDAAAAATGPGLGFPMLLLLQRGRN